MPFLPKQYSVQEKAVELTAFGGIRHDHRAGADRFFDMKNMSSDAFPLLTNRKKRRTAYTVTGNANGIFAKGALLWVDGTKLYYNGNNVGTVEDSPKSFAGMGSKVIIWPDKKVYDTENNTLTSLGASFTCSGTVTISLCDSDGANYAATPTVSATKPASASTGDLWMDTSETPHVLKKYSANSGRWTSVPTVYLKIAAANIGASFAAGDGVEISGCTNAALNASYVLQAAAAGYIVVIGTIDATITQTGALKVERKIPDLDYICELNNRIWGCDSANHEIRCCKLGDPKNWECYQGISTDSYTLKIGSDGDFTGCAAYGGNVVFFKQNSIMKIMGVTPDKFQLNPYECNGVAPGSAKSMVVANETLFYHSTAGICAYAGALPMIIGEDIGGPYTAATAGATDSKYYVSLKDSSDAWHLFAYDTRRGTWHREDDTRAIAFARVGSQLYMLTNDKQIIAIDDESDATVSPVEWMFETGELITDMRHQYLQKLILRIEADLNTRGSISFSYDGGSFTSVATVSNPYKKDLTTIPIRVQRCNSLRMRMQGSGDFKLHGIRFVYVDGGSHA